MRECSWDNSLTLAKGIFHTTGHHALGINWGRWQEQPIFPWGRDGQWSMDGEQLYFYGIVMYVFLLLYMYSHSFLLPPSCPHHHNFTLFQLFSSSYDNTWTFYNSAPIPVEQRRGMEGFTAWISCWMWLNHISVLFNFSLSDFGVQCREKKSREILHIASLRVE